MKKKLLDSFKGKSLEEACNIANWAGVHLEPVPIGYPIALRARANTVIIVVKDDDTVESASAGDPTELED